MKNKLFVPVERIRSIIFLIRRQKVILDSDLAELYGVETGALNRAVKRNSDRFPKDFMFQLTAREVERLRCQIGISKNVELGSDHTNVLNLKDLSRKYGLKSALATFFGGKKSF